MTTIIHQTDKYFSFHDVPITNCYIENNTLFFEFEFVFCWLNNNNTPAIYSSEGHPKLMIQLEKMINWTNWETGVTYTEDFESHLPNLIGIDFLAFDYLNNSGEITLVGEVFKFNFSSFQIIVNPTNLYFYRFFNEEEIEKYPISELPKTELPVSYH